MLLDNTNFTYGERCLRYLDGVYVAPLRLTFILRSLQWNSYSKFGNGALQLRK